MQINMACNRIYAFIGDAPLTSYYSGLRHRKQRPLSNRTHKLLSRCQRTCNRRLEDAIRPDNKGIHNVLFLKTGKRVTKDSGKTFAVPLMLDESARSRKTKMDNLLNPPVINVERHFWFTFNQENRIYQKQTVDDVSKAPLEPYAKCPWNCFSVHATTILDSLVGFYEVTKWLACTTGTLTSFSGRKCCWLNNHVGVGVGWGEGWR